MDILLEENIYNLVGGRGSVSPFTIVVISLFLVFIRIYLIFYSYNKIVPRIMQSLSGEDNVKFKKIQFEDAILIYILSKSLLTKAI